MNTQKKRDRRQDMTKKKAIYFEKSKKKEKMKLTTDVDTHIWRER